MNTKRYDTLKQGLHFIENLITVQSQDLHEFLHEMADFLSKTAQSTSCLIYMYNKDEKSMTLIGTVKGSKKFIEKLTLQKGEGITGWVAEHKKMVFIPKNAYKDARFKFIAGLPEDKYEGFLSLPIMLQDRLLGVVNLQYKSPMQLSKQQQDTIQSLVNILAYSFSIYAMQKQIDSLVSKLESRKLVEKAKGILMKKFKLSEDDAYARIREEAMKKRKKIEDIATSLLLIEKLI